MIRSASQTDSEITVGWDEDLPATASGCPWRIREAIGYAVNRFLPLPATLTEPDGVTTHDVTLIASDDKTIFWDAGSFTAGAGWSYSIDDQTVQPAPGGRYLRTGGEWVLRPDPAH